MCNRNLFIVAKIYCKGCQDMEIKRNFYLDKLVKRKKMGWLK